MSGAIAESLRLIPVSLLTDHPQNPRIALRDDVVAAIAAGLSGGFDPAHALLVRPFEGGYQILSGHHRKAAAIIAGIEAIPCWVRDLDDDAAYMALVTSNSQGELSPLERGIHFNRAGVGVREYARLTGRSATVVTHEAQAGRVFAHANTDAATLHDKARHLAEIHSLPSDCWPAAVQAMLDRGWSAKETAERVKAANVGRSAKVTLALFAGATSIRELQRIDEIRERVSEALSFDDLRAEWNAWFDEADPVDVKEVQAKRIEIEGRDFERREAQKEASSPALPSLVLADPPWRYDFAETDNRQIENQYPSATVDEIIGHRPETEPDCVLFLWATVAKLREALEVLDGWGFEYKTHAVWDKEKIGMGYWFRGQHELLLVGTKGKASPPDPENRVSSVFREARGAHSVKPECVYSWIEQAFPDHNKLEMYCRSPRPGWAVFGNEARRAA